MIFGHNMRRYHYRSAMRDSQKTFLCFNTLKIVSQVEADFLSRLMKCVKIYFDNLKANDWLHDKIS